LRETFNLVESIVLSCDEDWTRMGAARGIAGSMSPEEKGVFLCRDEFEARFFIDLNNTGGPVDIWVVTGLVSRS